MRTIVAFYAALLVTADARSMTFAGGQWGLVLCLSWMSLDFVCRDWRYDDKFRQSWRFAICIGMCRLSLAIDITYCAVALASFCDPSAQRERIIWTLQVLAISAIMWTKAILVFYATMSPDKPKWPARVSFFASTVHCIGMITLYTYAEFDPASFHFVRKSVVGIHIPCESTVWIARMYVITRIIEADGKDYSQLYRNFRYALITFSPFTTLPIFGVWGVLFWHYRPEGQCLGSMTVVLPAIYASISNLGTEPGGFLSPILWHPRLKALRNSLCALRTREIGHYVSRKLRLSRNSQQSGKPDVERGNAQNDRERYDVREETERRLRSPRSWENVPTPEEDTKVDEGEANTTRPVSSASNDHHGYTPRSAFDYTC